MDKENTLNSLPTCLDSNFVHIPEIQLKPLHLVKTNSLEWNLNGQI